MPRFNVPSRSRVWLRVAVPALLGIAAAGCSDSARFDSNPYASNRRSPPQETTGSISQRPAYSRVELQPLPAPGRPAMVASGGVATGAPGLGAYRPATPEITGSAAAHRAPAAAGHWTWDGGSPVTVGYGETVESIARKYGVPAAAIRETNGFREGASLQPGQRVVIPRYISASASHAPSPRQSVPARAAENVHIVEPGESLMGIAHKHGVTLVALARANNMQPYAKISIGDRLTIPGGRHVAERQTAAPQVAQPRTVPAEKVASAPVQTARASPRPSARPPKASPTLRKRPAACRRSAGR